MDVVVAIVFRGVARHLATGGLAATNETLGASPEDWRTNELVTAMAGLHPVHARHNNWAINYGRNLSC